MKRVLFIITLALLSCEEKWDLKSETISNTLYISGSSQFTNPLTSEVVERPVNVLYTIRRENGFPFPDSFKDTLQSADFSFGPLAKEKYLIKAKWSDPEYKINYEVEKLYNLADSSELKRQVLPLNWLKTPTAIVTLKDQSGAPVEGAEIYTYTNPAFLTQFKDNAEASVREGVTNSKGQVIFTNLEETTYYFYGVKRIGATVFRTSDGVLPSTPLTKDKRHYPITLQ